MKTDLLPQLKIDAETSRPLKGGGLILKGPRVGIHLPGRPARYLYHGWQSWTLSAWVDASRRLPVMRPALLHPMQTDPTHVRQRQPNGSWYGAVELDKSEVVFLGSLGLEAHVLLDDKTLTGAYETGNGEWFLGIGAEAELLAQYSALLKERLGSGRVETAPRVWCSWYSLYTEISEHKLVKVLGDLDGQGWLVEIFQVDDGWQKNIGDWEANDKFPAGMDGLAARIKATGRKAGLWLAPLLAVPSSSLYRDHPDWLLRDRKGRLVSAGFNWGEPLFALDTTHPGALAWLADLMKKVRGWGYEYAKLDFLYAGALPGKRHTDMPREQAYRNGLKVMREALGEAFLLTCGAPILPSLGLCDGMRIGPDVAGDWDNPRDRDLLGNYTIPGTQNALRTCLHRLWLQPLVQTDPDVVYFRARENHLTPAQKGLLQDLAQVAAFKATSDVPAWLDPAEAEALKSYMASHPKVEKTGPYKYTLDGREVDFGPYIEMPQPPGLFKSLAGGVLGALAGIPAFMRAFEKDGQKSLKKTIEANPV